MSDVIPATQATTLEGQGAKTLIQVLAKYEKTFSGVLPKQLDSKRWAWLCINSIRTTPRLCEVTAPSFINAVLLASNMALEIRARSCYLIPFGKECQLIIDYRGKMELARRAGVGAISLELVREGDEFDMWSDEKGPHFHHKWIGKERGEITYGYMSAEVNGSRQIEVMTIQQIEAIRRRSRSGATKPVNHYGKELPGLTLADIRKLDIDSLLFRHPYRVPWVTDYDQMARKSVMHRGSNYLPYRSDLALSQDVDTAVLGDKPMPQAPELMDFFEQLDPADNQPLVQLPEGSEEQRKEQERIVEQKTGEKPLRDYKKLPDAVEQVLGTEVMCKGIRWRCADNGESQYWQEVK